MEPAGRPTIREWLLRLGLVFLSGFVALVIVEAGLRLFGPTTKTYPAEFTRPDPALGWKGVPNARTTFRPDQTAAPIALDRNAHGFRDKERSFAKGKDVTRILVLGDSFTEAIQVPLDQTFPYLLEGLLNARPGRRFEVLNLGVGGFGTDQEYVLLMREGFQYEPDLVILAFYIGNDIGDNSPTINPWPPKPRFVLDNGTLEEQSFKILDEEQRGHLRRLKQIARALFPSTYLFLDSRISFSSSPRLTALLRRLGVLRPDTGRAVRTDTAQERETMRRIRLLRYDVYGGEQNPVWEEAWAVTEALILKMQRALDSNRVGFLVVLIPMEEEFRPDKWATIRAAYPADRAAGLDSRRPENRLTGFLETNRIDYLLLRPVFEKYRELRKQEFYLQTPGEIHWNAKGHGLTAELIYQKLCDSWTILEECPAK